MGYDFEADIENVVMKMDERQAEAYITKVARSTLLLWDAPESVETWSCLNPGEISNTRTRNVFREVSDYVETRGRATDADEYSSVKVAAARSTWFAIKGKLGNDASSVARAAVAAARAYAMRDSAKLAAEYCSVTQPSQEVYSKFWDAIYAAKMATYAYWATK